MDLVKYIDNKGIILVQTKVAKISTEAKKEFGSRALTIIASSKDSRIRDIKLEGRSEQLGNFVLNNDEEKRRAMVGMTVAKLARLYGATGVIPSDVMNGAVNLVVNQFSAWSLEEIELAFELAAAGRIEVEVTLYNKPFNLDWLSRILRRWKTYRMRPVALLDAAEGRIRAVMNKNEEEQKKKRDDAYIDMIERIVASYEIFIQNDSSEVLSFWNHWFKFLEKIEVLVVSVESKKRLFARSKAAAIQNKLNQLSEKNKKTTIERLNIKKSIEELKKGGTNGQAGEAINRLVKSWFIRMRRRNLESSELERLLAKEYKKRKEQLIQPRFNVTISLRNGEDKFIEKLTKKEIEELSVEAVKEFGDDLISLDSEIA